MAGVAERREMANYDTWKSKPDYGDEPEDECDHEDYEVDILTGRATCNMCGHSWWQSPEEIEAECRRCGLRCNRFAAGTGNGRRG